MKIFKDEKGISTMMAILAVVALLVIALAVAGFTMQVEDEVDEEEEDELEDEDLPEIQDYNYLKLNLIRKTLENDYELEIIGQSHGFCNTFIRHLLNIEGVSIAAYKDIRIEPSKIFIRLENKKYKIKDKLFKGIESLREDVL